MRHKKICVFIAFFLFIGFISQVSAEDTFTFEPFSGVLSEPVVVYRTYNLGQQYVSGTANFMVSISGGLNRNAMITSDGGHYWESLGGSSNLTLSVNPGQPVSFFQVSASGMPTMADYIVYSFSGSFRGEPLASVTPEVLSLSATPQAFEPEKTSVTLIAVTNTACNVDFTVQNSDGIIVIQNTVATTEGLVGHQANFVWRWYV